MLNCHSELQEKIEEATIVAERKAAEEDAVERGSI